MKPFSLIIMREEVQEFARLEFTSLMKTSSLTTVWKEVLEFARLFVWLLAFAGMKLFSIH